MSAEKAHPRSTFAVCLLLFTVVSRAPVAVGEEVTPVDVVFEQKATAFSAYDPVLLEEVRLSLLQEALRLLRESFPFLEWRAAGIMAAPTESPAVPLIKISMQSESVMGVRVYLTCAARMPGLTEIATSITADVIASSDFFPEPNPDNPEEDKQQLVERGRVALKDLILGTADAWEKKIIVEISLAKEVRTGNEQLILPLDANRLRASSESTLLIKFRGNVPDEEPAEGRIEVCPSGTVLSEGDPLQGKQKGRVTLFEYDGVFATQWHQRIPIVIQHRTPDTTRVSMKKYVAASPHLSTEP